MPPRPARPHRRGRRSAAAGEQLDAADDDPRFFDDDDPRFFDVDDGGPLAADRRRALAVFALPLDPVPFSSSSSSGEDPSAASLIPWREGLSTERAEKEGGEENEEGEEELLLVDRFDARLLLRGEASSSSSSSPSAAAAAERAIEAAVLRSICEAAPGDEEEDSEELDRIRYEFLPGHPLFRGEGEDYDET